jgi:hypothetical protein
MGEQHHPSSGSVPETAITDTLDTYDVTWKRHVMYPSASKEAIQATMGFCGRYCCIHAVELGSLCTKRRPAGGPSEQRSNRDFEFRGRSAIRFLPIRSNAAGAGLDYRRGHS